jgi:hypothetical protein
MSSQQQTHDESLVKALELGIKKARELGYEVEKMKIALSASDGVCMVYFELIPEPGHVALGGDLTVKVDLKTRSVIDFERGQ